ncbi:MAG: hypothetical protein RIE73_20440 [Coleofasciculus sp. C1-SOL-03]
MRLHPDWTKFTPTPILLILLILLILRSRYPTYFRYAPGGETYSRFGG